MENMEKFFFIISISGTLRHSGGLKLKAVYTPVAVFLPSAPGSRSGAAGACGSPLGSGFHAPLWRSSSRPRLCAAAAPARLYSTSGAPGP